MDVTTELRRLTTDRNVYRRGASLAAPGTKWHRYGCGANRWMPEDDEVLPARLTRPEDRCRSCLWRLPIQVYHCEEGDLITAGKGGMALHAVASGHAYFDGPRLVQVQRVRGWNQHHWLND